MVVDAFTLLNSFLLGLTASFAPCLFPVLPTFVAYLLKEEPDDDINNRAGPDRRGGMGSPVEGSKMKGVYLGLSVVAGIMLVFLLMNAIVSAVGTVLNVFLIRNYLRFRFGQGVILVILGAMIARSIAIDLPGWSRLTTWVNTTVTGLSSSYLQAFFIGVFFAVLAAPCAFIVFAAYFSLVLFNPGILNVVLLTLFFSTGAGLPFIAAGGLLPTLSDGLISKRKKLLSYLPMVTGLVLVAVGTYLMYDANSVVAEVLG